MLGRNDHVRDGGVEKHSKARLHAHTGRRFRGGILKPTGRKISWVRPKAATIAPPLGAIRLLVFS